jgi:uncharacterized protein YndB with AHSA1/START domain
MPVATKVLPETKAVIDRETNSIMLRRTFDASREEIFAAWTQPEHVACWWDAAGMPLVECEIDLRPGGAFKFVNRDHADFPFTGIYREITPPQQLVFEAMGSIGKVLLESVGGNTLLTVTIKCGSAAQLDQFLKMGIDVGTAQTLDNLVAHVDAVKQDRLRGLPALKQS